VRTIVLYGHQSAAEAAFALVDHLLRQAAARDIGLVLTVDVDQVTARSLRAAGAELWFCGPTLGTADGSWSPAAADRYLVGRPPEALAGKVLGAYTDFMAHRQVAA
jgi:hypothetical protein